MIIEGVYFINKVNFSTEGVLPNIKHLKNDPIRGKKSPLFIYNKPAVIFCTEGVLCSKFPVAPNSRWYPNSVKGERLLVRTLAEVYLKDPTPSMQKLSSNNLYFSHGWITCDTRGDKCPFWPLVSLRKNYSCVLLT